VNNTRRALAPEKEKTAVFEKILYPTDFSEVAAKAVDYLKQLKSAGAEEVVVLNVIHQRVIDTIGTINSVAYFHDGRYVENPDEAIDKLVAERKKRLEPIVADLEAVGFKVKMLVRMGSPRREILRVEKEENVSAIVIGSHGRSNIAEMLIGSVSEKVVRRSRVPVIVIKR
jgi:nucleotide-binding universal stress UspA family protein